jgi:hypothetical protein
MGHCSKAPLGYRLVETKRFTGLPGGAEAPGGGNWATIVPGSPPVRVSTFPIASFALKTCWTADVAVYTVLRDYSRGIFTSGVLEFGLAEDGVDIAYSGGFIDDIRPQIEDLRAKIIAGEVVVPSKPARD